MIETALKYVVGFLIENEEIKKFPQDFVTSSMQWIRSWFLIDDPVADAVASLPGNEEAKKAAIQAKLPKLLKNETFVQELEAQIQAFQAERTKLSSITINNNNVGNNNRNTANVQGNISGNLDITQF